MRSCTRSVKVQNGPHARGPADVMREKSHSSPPTPSVSRPRKRTESDREYDHGSLSVFASLQDRRDLIPNPQSFSPFLSLSRGPRGGHGDGERDREGQNLARHGRGPADPGSAEAVPFTTRARRQRDRPRRRASARSRRADAAASPGTSRSQPSSGRRATSEREGRRRGRRVRRSERAEGEPSSSGPLAVRAWTARERCDPVTSPGVPEALRSGRRRGRCAGRTGR